MTEEKSEISIKCKIDLMIVKINNPEEYIDVKEFLQTLEDILLINLSENEVNLLKSFAKEGYVKKLIQRLTSEQKNTANLTNRIIELENKVYDLINDNTSLKNDITILKNDNASLKNHLGKVENSYKRLANQMENLLMQNVGQIDKKDENKEVLENIKQRDNYKAIIYVILVSLGYSFEQVYKAKNYESMLYGKKMKPEFYNIFYGSLFNMDIGNKTAHDSPKTNIIGSLFPKLIEINGDLRYKFNDEILNKAKGIIKNLQNYVLKKNITESYEKEMNDVTALIKTELNEK